jgi:hypothetical protein
MYVLLDKSAAQIYLQLLDLYAQVEPFFAEYAGNIRAVSILRHGIRSFIPLLRVFLGGSQQRLSPPSVLRRRMGSFFPQRGYY